MTMHTFQRSARFLALALIPALVMAFASCGAEKDARSLVSEANTALNNGDHQAALASFAAALSTAGTDESLRHDARLGRCEALAYLDADKAQAEFIALAEEQALSYSAYNTIAVALNSEQKFDQAIAVLTHGKEKMPGEKKFDGLVKKVGDSATNAGASDALKALEGLGYVGN